MNNFQKKLQDHTHNLRLTSEEKFYMRSALLDAMEASTATPSKAPPSRSFLFHSRRFTAALSGTFAGVLLLGTTTFAAQGALPGDPLYPVKIHVNETAFGVAAVGDEAKAKWNASVAEERVKEATQLALAGKLSSRTVAELESDFDDHAQKVVSFAKKVREKDPKKSSKISEDFSSSLEKHSDVLAEIGRPASLAQAAAPVAKMMAISTSEEEEEDTNLDDDSPKKFSDHIRARSKEIRDNERQSREEERDREETRN